MIKSYMACTTFNLTPFPQFGGASAFNQDISSWDVSSVTSMAQMVSFAMVDLRASGLEPRENHAWFALDLT